MANKQKLRPIVSAAFKCDELVYQFTRIDVEDGLLVSGDEDEVNAKYADAYIIKEAEHRLTISQCNIEEGGWEGEELKMHQREARQLRTFLKRFKREAVAS
tara:strand:- start:175 stop:477 length:303 start_codon:yes stop_codon:yes gene_type:complete